MTEPPVPPAAVQIAADVLAAYGIGEPVVGDVADALAAAGWLTPPDRRAALDAARARVAELEEPPEFDGFPYLRLALTRTFADQQTVTFRRETLVQAVRQCNELEAEVERLREEMADNARELAQLRPLVRVLIRDDTRALARGEGRTELVARLRAVIEWVSEHDHARAIELDAVVHELEQLAAAPAPED